MQTLNIVVKNWVHNERHQERHAADFLSVTV
jgi:hypothetical protein